MKISLFNKDFKLALQQMMSNLYMHMNSKEDIEKEIQEQKDDHFAGRVLTNQNCFTKFGSTDKKSFDTYQYD